MSTLQVARFMVGFGWIYHGLFPKILHIAPLEALMTESIGFSSTVSYWITKSAGISEIIFGIAFIVLYRMKWIVVVNILGLLGLLVFVAILQPQLLIEAFNPVTTNLMMVALSCILLIELQKEGSNVEV